MITKRARSSSSRSVVMRQRLIWSSQRIELSSGEQLEARVEGGYPGASLAQALEPAAEALTVARKELE